MNSFLAYKSKTYTVNSNVSLWLVVLYFTFLNNELIYWYTTIFHKMDHHNEII